MLIVNFTRKLPRTLKEISEDLGVFEEIASNVMNKKGDQMMNNYQNKIFSFFIVALFLFPVGVRADDVKLLSMVQDLQEKMIKMQYTIDQQNGKIRAG